MRRDALRAAARALAVEVMDEEVREHDVAGPCRRPSSQSNTSAATTSTSTRARAIAASVAAVDDRLAVDAASRQLSASGCARSAPCAACRSPSPAPSSTSRGGDARDDQSIERARQQIAALPMSRFTRRRSRRERTARGSSGGQLVEQLGLDAPRPAAPLDAAACARRSCHLEQRAVAAEARAERGHPPPAAGCAIRAAPPSSTKYTNALLKLPYSRSIAAL